MKKILEVRVIKFTLYPPHGIGVTDDGVEVFLPGLGNTQGHNGSRVWPKPRQRAIVTDKIPDGEDFFAKAWHPKPRETKK